MAGPQQQPIIIIRRKKKGGGEAHHGGAWKVAYADFVTAMMAFFLLLWLLNVTTDEARHGIADYFTPASIARSESGAGGTMGGRTITAPGAMVSESSPADAVERMVPTAGQGEEGEADSVGKSETDGGLERKDGTGAPEKEKGAAAIAKQEAQENARFQQAAEQLKQALQESPALQGLADRIMVDQTPEGLRIQIVDKNNSSMFPSGSAILYENSRDLLRLVGKVISRLPNKISIAGHTDSAPFSATARRDNWTLSTERANVCRVALTEAGVSPERIARVIGMADREPLEANPNGPKNRRISITLLRYGNAPDAAVPAAFPEAVTPALSSGNTGEPLLPSVLPPSP